MTDILKISPIEIEKKSFEIITEELGEKILDSEQAPIIKRVIHTSADFEYADNLYFSPDAIEQAKKALTHGAHIVTDTKMAMAGINKKSLSKLGCTIDCFIQDEDVAEQAKSKDVTRASVSVDKAMEYSDNLIYVVGNAPTALIRLKELMDKGNIPPKLIIGVPVGFVNVVAAKELIIESGCPCIVSRGRKGGSNVAAAIVNALLYIVDESRGM